MVAGIFVCGITVVSRFDVDWVTDGVVVSNIISRFVVSCSWDTNGMVAGIIATLPSFHRQLQLGHRRVVAFEPEALRGAAAVG